MEQQAAEERRKIEDSSAAATPNKKAEGNALVGAFNMESTAEIPCFVEEALAEAFKDLKDGEVPSMFNTAFIMHN
eukprot:102632-Prorocentrum_lima.AAC.1